MLRTEVRFYHRLSVDKDRVMLMASYMLYFFLEDKINNACEKWSYNYDNNKKIK